MTSSEKFYITTTLPYVNAEPHLGFALEIVQADTLARYWNLLGREVFFNTGTDEHGLKIYRRAREEGKDVQQYVDEYAEKFKRLIPALGVSSDVHFIRTTDKHHLRACQEFWNRCLDRGDIYKKIYHVKYCVGCELEKTESDLDGHGRCLIHPNLTIETIEEENYFFRFSRYQKPLLEHYEKYPDFVVPDFRFNEIKEFVKRGLQDFSISRLKEKMPWGVPVPDDETHVMYVWFDALINYVSTLGWPESENRINQKSGISDFASFWGTRDNPRAVQIAGKDNLRQQSAMWQAMLMSAGLPPSRQIIIHGFITSGGQKMSKSLGNVADPYSIIDKLKAKGLTNEQAVDALRYYLLREIPTFEDGDYTWDRLVESYNANLANGLGNLAARVLKMAVANKVEYSKQNEQNLLKRFLACLALAPKKKFKRRLMNAVGRYLKHHEIQKAVNVIWEKIGELDHYIQAHEPFKTVKIDRQRGEKDIQFLIYELYDLAEALKPFLPRTAERILQALNTPKEENIPHLFPRIE